MITWYELDLCASADEIADVLRRHGIHGSPGSPKYCPLARATGWYVRARSRYTDKGDWAELTAAQKAFVRAFDYGRYLDLADYTIARQ